MPEATAMILRFNRAFRAGMRGHLSAAGMGRPAGHEHLWIETLGWS